MISLKEILNYQLEETQRIRTISQSIHPKLLKRFGHFDFIDPNLDAQDLNDKFNSKIKPLISDYQNTLKRMINKHLVDFIEGWILVNSEGRWAIKRSDGTTCAAVDPNIVSNYDDYLLDMEIDDYCQTVHGMLAEHELKPFWQYSYIINASGVRISIDYSSTAEVYVNNALKKLNSVKPCTNILEELAKDSISLPYKMNLPPIGYEMTRIIRDDDLRTMVEHHKVLNAFFETYDENNRPTEPVVSYIKDGVIKFKQV